MDTHRPQVRVAPPNEAARLSILRIHAKKLPLDISDAPPSLADDTSTSDTVASNQALVDAPRAEQREHGLRLLAATLVGYTGADIAALCREAAFCALRRVMRTQQHSASKAAAAVDDLCATWDDFTTARAKVGASALRSMAPAPPSTTWDDIGGLHDVKDRLRQVCMRSAVLGVHLRVSGVAHTCLVVLSAVLCCCDVLCHVCLVRCVM